MKHASQLGKMAAGVPKKYSPAEIAKRTARLRKAQTNRAKTQRVRSSVRRKSAYFNWLENNSTIINREDHQWGVCCERGIAYGKTLESAVESAMNGDFA